VSETKVVYQAGGQPDRMPDVDRIIQHCTTDIERNARQMLLAVARKDQGATMLFRYQMSRMEAHLSNFIHELGTASIAASTDGYPDSTATVIDAFLEKLHLVDQPGSHREGEERKQ